MFEDAPDHFGTSFAGQTLDWMPTDTAERFAELMQEPLHRRYFEGQGWHQPGAITYRINSHGFRCAELSTDPCVLALGCSFTVGIGLPVETIWPELVGKSLGLEVVNLAWGGYSADTCFRLAEYWVPRLRPELVVMMAPPCSRFELLLDRDLLAHHHRDQPFEVIMPASQSPLVTDSPLIRHWFGNEENQRLNGVRNRLAVQALCDLHRVRCVTDDVIRHMCWSTEDIGYARDFLHGGPLAHRRIAEWILNELKN